MKREEKQIQSHRRTKHLLESFYFALQGLGYAFKTQRNFRIHIAIAIIALLLGVVLNISQPEWVAIIALIGLVLFAELINTAMELCVDWLSQGKYIKAVRHIKDIAAGAVFITAVSALICGLIIFFPRLRLFFNLGH